MTSHASFPPTISRGHASISLIDVLIASCVLVLLVNVDLSTASSGCADGSREGLRTFESAAACAGSWEGHVNNANVLCASGWRVCTSFDFDVLSNISWGQAIAVQGCMAINAAQDGGRCRQCRDDLEQDDMAGIGENCPHHMRGQSSCISGGRIDASCCVDSHFHSACHFKPSHMTGVVCCRLPVKKPNIVVKPPERLRVYKNMIFLLTCQASGMPPPRVYWYKNGSRLPKANSRISALSSGDLMVTRTRKSDSGLYTCEAINEEGIDMISSYVKVSGHHSRSRHLKKNRFHTGHHSRHSKPHSNNRVYPMNLAGCADGTTDGLSSHATIHACHGEWEGHVKYGRSLCARGWRVCSARNHRTLSTLTFSEVSKLRGCYAYNSANRQNRCKRCKSDNMAGVGRDCGWSNSTLTSCLGQGQIGVFKPDQKSTCEYTPGVTSGVLCCRKLRRRKVKRIKCTPACQNNAVCTYYNKCLCTSGYKGARCQHAICKPDCGSKGDCIRPNKCKCKPGYTGKTCRSKTIRCKGTCLNGGRCHRGQCRCASGFWGKGCQHLLQHALLSRLNRTER